MPVGTHKLMVEEDTKRLYFIYWREPERALLLHGLRWPERKLMMWEWKQEGAKKRKQPSLKPNKAAHTTISWQVCAAGAEWFCFTLLAKLVGWRLCGHPLDWFAPGDKEYLLKKRYQKEGREKDKGWIMLGSSEQKVARTQLNWGITAHVPSCGTQSLARSWRLHGL